MKKLYLEWLETAKLQLRLIKKGIMSELIVCNADQLSCEMLENYSKAIKRIESNIEIYKKEIEAEEAKENERNGNEA